MHLSPRFLFSLLCLSLLASWLSALERPETTFKVFQFPADKIPRVDGNGDDWALVPESYVVGTDQLVDTDKKHPGPNPKTLDVRVRVGWVKGLNRLYFLYEAYDNYWDFSKPDLHNDTFEIMVDGDASGGPFLDTTHRDVWAAANVGPVLSKPEPRISAEEAHWAQHGVHAQNYHIFTPAVEKDWALAWVAATWIKEFPHANSACSYNFKPGEAGKLTLEFWITPYDYAGPEGPQRAVESVLRDNKIIGLGWIIIDFDDVNSKRKDGFWCLAPKREMFGNASLLPAFRLMPLEPQFLKSIEARWSFKVVDLERRAVAFLDESVGEVTRWRWDFGDGSSSEERYPLHHYAKPGNYIVVLEIEGPTGKSRRAKIWDVQLR